MICRLCLKDTKLINSHIIPEGFFRFLYPENDKASLEMFSTNDNFSKRRPIGSYELMLCADCDQKNIGQLDQYAQDIFIKPKLFNISEGDKFYIIQDVDCQKIKKFFLSLLWRSSVSKLPEFNRINVGIKYEEYLRLFLYKNCLDYYQNFSIIIGKFTNKNLGDICDKNIHLPFQQKIEHINFSIFYLPNGFKCFIKVDNRKLPEEFKAASINESDSKIIVLKLKEYSETLEFKLMLEMLNK